VSSAAKISIDKNVPVPPASPYGGAPIKFPWRDMVPGDSFFAAGYVTSVKRAKNGEPSMNFNNGKKAHPGSKWMSRTVTENGVNGCRVWRVA
jgi:hypothetical protein